MGLRSHVNMCVCFGVLCIRQKLFQNGYKTRFGPGPFRCASTAYTIPKSNRYMKHTLLVSTVTVTSKRQSHNSIRELWIARNFGETMIFIHCMSSATITLYSFTYPPFPFNFSDLCCYCFVNEINACSIFSFFEQYFSRVKDKSHGWVCVLTSSASHMYIFYYSLICWIDDIWKEK